MLTDEEGASYNMLMCAIHLQEVIFSKLFSLITYHLKEWSTEHIFGEEKLPTVYPVSNPLGLIFIIVSSS